MDLLVNYRPEITLIRKKRMGISELYWLCWEKPEMDYLLERDDILLV
jgi:hypothetical protein